MIGWREYRRLTDAQVRGRLVRTLVALETPSMRVPAGTVLTVRGKWKGYALEATTCPACGVTMQMRKVPPADLDWVTVPYPQGCQCARYPDQLALDCHVHLDAPLHFDAVCYKVPDESFYRPTLNEDHPCHCP